MSIAPITEITPEIEADIRASVAKITGSKDIRKMHTYLFVCHTQNRLLENQLADLQNTGTAKPQYNLTKEEGESIAKNMPSKLAALKVVREALLKAFTDNASLVLKVNAQRHAHGLPTLRTFSSNSYK